MDILVMLEDNPEHSTVLAHVNSVPAPLNYAPPGYKPFPKSICTSVNHQVCHGVPGERVLKPGDILNAEEGLAARQLRDTAILQYDRLRAAATAGDAQALADLPAHTYLASLLEAKVEAASGTEVGRALAARQIRSTVARGSPFQQVQDTLRLLHEGELGLEGEASVRQTAQDIVTRVRRAAEQQPASVGPVADALDATAQAGGNPAELVANLYAVLLKGAAQAQDLPGADANSLRLWSQLMADVQQRIIDAVPEGALVGGLYEHLLQGVLRQQDLRAVDPRLLLSYTHHLTDRAEHEAFVKYYAGWTRRGALVDVVVELAELVA